MRAYLVQHGKAKSAEEDPNRSLTDEGRAEVTAVAEFLSSLRITVALVEHSGKIRAEETAHIFATTMRTASGPCHTRGLDPSDDPTEMAHFLKIYTDDVLIVGHLPNLEWLTSLLLNGVPDRRPVRFTNAGVVCLEKDSKGTWSLIWAVIPELLLPKVRLAA